MNAPRLVRALAAAGLAIASAAAAQTPAPGSGEAPRPGVRGTETLSPAQVARVKAVLAPYRPGSLTVDDAKAIKRALRDEGMRPSPALEKALRAEGFSAERLDQLDPRPPGPPGAGERPPPRGDGPPPRMPGKPAPG